MAVQNLKLFGMKAEQGRWILVVTGLLINICLGSIYAFSVFRKPLEALWGISSSQSGSTHLWYSLQSSRLRCHLQEV